MDNLFPEIKSIMSPDLDHGVLPQDPENCAVLIEVEIGVKGKDGADIFSFTAITPKALSTFTEKHWGKGYLIMPSFSWKEAEHALHNLLMQCSGKDWDVISSKISKELGWEFDNYQPYNS